MGFSVANLVAIIPALLIGFAFHEAAHGYMAYLLGDNTAKNHGRLTLNPIAHLDPLGTIMLIVTQRFGWAKPVPVNPVNFSRKITMRTGMMLVSLAGPLTNLVIAFVSAMVVGVMLGLGYSDPFMITILQNIVVINVSLGLFNLIPVPPLDGSKILAGVLPRKYDFYLDKLDNYGMVILLLLFITPIGGILLGPPITLVYDLLTKVTGLIAVGLS